MNKEENTSVPAPTGKAPQIVQGSVAVAMGSTLYHYGWHRMLDFNITISSL